MSSGQMYQNVIGRVAQSSYCWAIVFGHIPTKRGKVSFHGIKSSICVPLGGGGQGHVSVSISCVFLGGVGSFYLRICRGRGVNCTSGPPYQTARLLGGGGGGALPPLKVGTNCQTIALAFWPPLPISFL